MEVLRGQRGRSCCRRRRLQVHVATGARLFTRRATPPRRVPVHAGALAASYFPALWREGKRGRGGQEHEGETKQGQDKDVGGKKEKKKQRKRNIQIQKTVEKKKITESCKDGVKF